MLSLPVLFFLGLSVLAPVLYSFLLSYAQALPHAPISEVPSASDLLSLHEGGQYYESSSSPGTQLEYFSLHSPSKNAGRPKTAVVNFHASYGTGKGACRLNFAKLADVLDLFQGTDVGMICPSLPGFGASAPYPWPAGFDHSDGAHAEYVGAYHAKFTRDVLELVKELGYTSAFAAGTELGSFQAAHFASKAAAAGLEMGGLLALNPPALGGQDVGGAGVPEFLGRPLRYLAAHLRSPSPSSNPFLRWRGLAADWLSLKGPRGSWMAPLLADARRAAAHFAFGRMVQLARMGEGEDVGDLVEVLPAGKPVHVHCAAGDEGCRNRAVEEWGCGRRGGGRKLFVHELESRLAAPVEAGVYQLLADGGLAGGAGGAGAGGGAEAGGEHAKQQGGQGAGNI
ncbi:hypothetical protein TeGR_g5482 [Tetraparma gracilis]|uniref:AB hydrolase-1 domain-containing protein n=1 Tax=Tetraparma gracilis TaxID=2962635 RepID=A0ABQ6MDA3_9STRA|nr:hypothetical protein TeGR_g5482 [Tetraparma gracilis]